MGGQKQEGRGGYTATNVDYEKGLVSAIHRRGSLAQHTAREDPGAKFFKKTRHGPQVNFSGRGGEMKKNRKAGGGGVKRQAQVKRQGSSRLGKAPTDGDSLGKKNWEKVDEERRGF